MNENSVRDKEQEATDIQEMDDVERAVLSIRFIDLRQPSLAGMVDGYILDSA